MLPSPVHKDDPIDNVENGKKNWKEDKEEKIHSGSTNFILRNKHL